MCSVFASCVVDGEEAGPREVNPLLGEVSLKFVKFLPACSRYLLLGRYTLSAQLCPSRDNRPGHITDTLVYNSHSTFDGKFELRLVVVPNFAVTRMLFFFPSVLSNCYYIHCISDIP